MLTRLRLTAITVRPKTTPGCAAASASTDRQENFPGLGVNRPAAWRRRFFNWGRRQGPAGRRRSGGASRGCGNCQDAGYQRAAGAARRGERTGF